MDYSLAKRTDPSSLMAVYGSARCALQIFCPRSIDRAATELVSPHSMPLGSLMEHSVV
jgi:hypothetical protein